MTRGRAARRGFTLMELLVVVSIGAVVMSLIATAASKLRQGARGVACRTNLRAIALDFTIFADGTTADRGKTSNGLPIRGQFYLRSFADKTYRVGDFWESGDASPRMEPSQEPIICPAGPDGLQRMANRPCDDGGVAPNENVSLAFNRRLYYQSIGTYDNPRVEQAVLDSRLLNHSDVPLVFDVDGGKAVRPITPYFSAPPIEGWHDYYSRYPRYWFPSMRHAGKMNVVFIGGHVLGSADPLHEPGWDWTYQFKTFNQPKK